MFPVWSESGQLGWEFRPEHVSRLGAAPQPYEADGMTVREDSKDESERRFWYRLNAEHWWRVAPISPVW